MVRERGKGGGRAVSYVCVQMAQGVSHASGMADGLRGCAGRLRHAPGTLPVGGDGAAGKGARVLGRADDPQSSYHQAER